MVQKVVDLAKALLVVVPLAMEEAYQAAADGLEAVLELDQQDMALPMA